MIVVATLSARAIYVATEIRSKTPASLSRLIGTKGVGDGDPFDPRHWSGLADRINAALREALGLEGKMTGD